MNKTKICTKCGKEKSESEFYRNKRFGLTHWCKECFYLTDQERKAKDPLAYQEQNKRKTKKHYHKDGQGREYLKKRWQTNETYRKQVNESKKTPRGKVRVARYNAKRHSNSKDDPKLTYEQVQELLMRQNHKCNKCGKPFSKNRKRAMSLDHIYPQSKGGKLVMGNVQILCISCNSSKGNRT